MDKEIAETLNIIKRNIESACMRSNRNPADVTLIAISKMVDADTVKKAFYSGIRHFGENKVQDAFAKIPAATDLKPPPCWHMVGRLQTNKVKKALELFSYFHGIDSVELAQAISERSNSPIPIFLQVNVSGESTKTGFNPEYLNTALKKISCLSNLKIEGLMTIAPDIEDKDAIRRIFRELRLLRDTLGLRHLSMGMSNDYEIAIEEGATFIRIGRAIFGELVR